MGIQFDQCDRACATITLGAAFLRASQRGIFTQHIQQRLLLCVSNQVGLAIDDGVDESIKWAGWKS